MTVKAPKRLNLTTVPARRILILYSRAKTSKNPETGGFNGGRCVYNKNSCRQASASAGLEMIKINKRALLESLKTEAAFIDEGFLREKLRDLNLEMAKDGEVSTAQKLSEYNIETMLELKSKTLEANEDDLVDDMDVRGLKSAIDAYMDQYAEGEKELKTYVRIIAVYLTFIAKRPLHPVSMFDAEGEVLYRNGKAVCPLRQHEINKPNSLCHFCVSTYSSNTLTLDEYLHYNSRIINERGDCDG
jgi:uncharacterized protein (UPF0305 family)